jgi:hypothetical protein
MHPLFCADEHAVDEALVPAHLLLVGELVEERPPQIEQHCAGGPFFQPAVDRTLGAVSFR